MVCVPCIFLGLAMVVCCKFIDPYMKPLYQSLCRRCPTIKTIADRLTNVGIKLAEKLSIRMPDACPMGKQNKTASNVTLAIELFPLVFQHFLVSTQQRATIIERQ